VPFAPLWGTGKASSTWLGAPQHLPGSHLLTPTRWRMVYYSYHDVYIIELIVAYFIIGIQYQIFEIPRIGIPFVTILSYQQNNQLNQLTISFLVTFRLSPLHSFPDFSTHA